MCGFVSAIILISQQYRFVIALWKCSLLLQLFDTNAAAMLESSEQARVRVEMVAAQEVPSQAAPTRPHVRNDNDEVMCDGT